MAAAGARGHAQVYRVGYHHLAGWEALDYVRQRELLPGGDTDRQRHTRQVLIALLAKVRTSGVPADDARAAAFLRQVQRAATVDSGVFPLLSLVHTLSAVDQRNLVGVQLPTDVLTGPAAGAVIPTDPRRNRPAGRARARRRGPMACRAPDEVGP